jgi:hypothetical protein
MHFLEFPLGYNTYKHGNVTMKLPVLYLKQKCLFSKTEQEGKTGPVWGLAPVGRGRI